MANHKSAKKRIRSTEKRRVVNKSSLSRMKTLIKNVYAADAATVENIYRTAVGFIDKISDKGRIHKNNAARKKAALTLYVNDLLAENKATA